MTLQQHRAMNLRQALRRSTQEVHDQLDSSLDFEALCDPGTYRKFLTAQMSARKPIEDWLAEHCPAEIRPPAQAHLLQQDLDEIGEAQYSSNTHAFRLDDGAGILGAVWALAGSSLGNRTILSKLVKQGCDGLPTRFLADTKMPLFWKNLLPRIEQEASEEAINSSCLAAHAVFARFTDAMRNG